MSIDEKHVNRWYYKIFHVWYQRDTKIIITMIVMIIIILQDFLRLSGVFRGRQQIITFKNKRTKKNQLNTPKT